MKWLVVFLIAVTASAEEVRVSVRGMVCGFCAQGITKKFSAQNAVKDVKVSLDEETVTLHLREALSDAAIAEILKDAGFDPGIIKREVSLTQ